MRPDRARPATALGLVLLLAYALPLFFPPGAQPLLPPTPETTLLQRLFPSVPGWWMVVRLACLAMGAVLLAVDAGRPLPLHLSAAGQSAAPPRRLAVWLALAFACGQLALSLVAADLAGWQQAVYFVALMLPAMILATSSGAQARHGRRRRHRLLLPLGGLLLAWCALRIPAAFHSPRAATPVDLWLNFQWLTQVVTGTGDVLSGSAEPGIPNTYMFFAGASLLSDGLPPSLTWVQSWHVVWIAAAAVVLALLVAATVGRAAALVATTVLLFSPLLLMMHLAPAPLAILWLFTLLMLLWLRQVHAHRSQPALAALGAVAGIAATFPHLTHISLAICAVAAIVALLRPRMPWTALATAAAGFSAAVIPSLPSLEAAQTMSARLLYRSWQWAGTENLLLGQHSPFADPTVNALMKAGRVELFDLPLGGLLMPFATPRTALRLCGDTMIEPLGAALAAVGLAVCLRHLTRHGAFAILTFWVLALLPAAVTSQYDRVSLTRSIALPVAVALLAAVGFETVRRALVDRRRQMAMAAAAVISSAVSGLVLFDVVNPRILRASWLEIVAETTAATDDRQPAVVLDYREQAETTYLHVGRIAHEVPSPPLPTQGFDGAASLETVAAEGRETTLFWSPGLEEHAGVAAAVCGRWPQAQLYTLGSRSMLSRAWAARPAGGDWRPPLPGWRWSQYDCDAATESRIP